MPPTHPAEKRVSYTFDALGMTINRTAFNLQKAFARFRYSSRMVFPLEMATFPKTLKPLENGRNSGANPQGQYLYQIGRLYSYTPI
jgi:hypothetical protein